MKKSSLEDARQVFVDIADEEKRIAREVDDNIKRMSEKYEVIVSIKSYVDALVGSFRKGYSSLSVDEKEKLVNLFVDRLSSYLEGEAKASRDLVMINKGKSIAGNEFAKRAIEKYETVLNEALRIEEVASKLENNEIIPNGRNRKAGTRPEKLSVIRKAQAIIESKQETPDAEES
jgi:hypothetical protein